MPVIKLFVTPGQRIGCGVVLAEIRMPQNARQRANGWLGDRGARMLCDCGNEYSVALGNFRPRQNQPIPVQSCGCYRSEKAKEVNRLVKLKHGLTNHSHYKRWQGMMRRCYNEASSDYAHYGGRGIRVCDEWHDLVVFINYLNDVLGPIRGRSLDRIDVNGNYEPGNVRWADQSTQCANQRRWER